MTLANQELRKIARDRGEKFYLPSVPCQRGHLTKRWVSTSGCVECQTQTAQERVRTNKPCQFGHVSGREPYSGSCIKCREISKRKSLDRMLEQNRVESKREQGVRLAAIERGDKEYFTGRPCSRGHVVMRNLQGQCTACKNEDTSAFIKRHQARYTAHAGKRRAKKLHATPKWADQSAITEFYVNCPKGCHVDHIIPLQGELVSGLHVHNNLQYLPASENARKHNKFTPYVEVLH